MRTRAQDQLGGTTDADGPTQGTHRKRRSSSVAASNAGDNAFNDEDRGDERPRTPPRQTKRQRRTRRNDTQQLSDDFDENLDHNDHVEPNVNADEAHHDGAFQTTKHVHFSASINIANGHPTPPDTLLRRETGLTPHLNRTRLTPPDTASRRAYGRSPRRHSLHPNMPGTPDRLIDRLQFTPLRQILDSRLTRRLRRNHLSEEVNNIERHKRMDVKKEREFRGLYEKIEEKDRLVKELMLELEERRQRGIELTSEEEEHEAKQRQLEEELHKLREELVLRQEENGVHDDVDLNDQASESSFMLVDPADIDISTEDMTPRTRHADSSPIQPRIFSSSPPTSIHDPTYESEIHQLEDSIAGLIKELADANSALLVLSNELQGLGFTSTDAPPKDVIVAVRLAFHQARVDVQGLIPEQDQGQYENGPFLQLLVSNIRGLMEKVDEQLQLINRQQEMEAILGAQNRGILDKLAQVDARKSKLEATNLQLDMEFDNHERKIVELEDTIVDLKVKVKGQEMTIINQKQTISELEGEREDDQVSLDRLKDALETYRRDLADTERLVERTQKEHEDSIAQLEQNRDGAIADLTRQLEEEKTARRSVEQTLSDERTHINKLREQISAAENELAELKEQLSQSQSHTEAEYSRRAQAETALDKKSDFIASLERKVSALEESLAEFKGELDELRAAFATERCQREDAETELDSRIDVTTEIEQRPNEPTLSSDQRPYKASNSQDLQLSL